MGEEAPKFEGREEIIAGLREAFRSLRQYENMFWANFWSNNFSEESARLAVGVPREEVDKFISQDIGEATSTFDRSFTEQVKGWVRKARGAGLSIQKLKELRDEVYGAVDQAVK